MNVSLITHCLSLDFINKSICIWYIDSKFHKFSIDTIISNGIDFFIIYNFLPSLGLHYMTSRHREKKYSFLLFSVWLCASLMYRQTNWGTPFCLKFYIFKGKASIITICPYVRTAFFVNLGMLEFSYGFQTLKDHYFNS